MSIKVMSMVWDADLPRNQKMILLAYADHADDEGQDVYPSVGRTAWKTGYSERAVQQITRELEEVGVLIREGKGPRGTNRFAINLNQLPKRPEYGGEKIAPPAESAPGGVQKSAERGAESAPEPSEEPSEEPSAARGEPFEFYENHFGLITPKAERAINRDVDRYGLVWVRDAMRIAIDNDARSWRYVTTILERWEREGRGPRDRQNGQGDVTAEAWAVVAAAIKKGRADPIMARQDVLDTLNNIGGWRRVKDASEREITFIKKEFMKEYHV